MAALFSQAHSGDDVDFVLPVHVAQQHRHNGHDASNRQRHPGESVWRPRDPEAEVQVR